MTTPYISEGLNLSNIMETSPEEIENNLKGAWRRRGPMYQLQINSLMLDYAPEFAKLHRWAADLYGRPEPANIVTLASQNLHTYIHQGWEVGIINSLYTLRGEGMTKAQFMEIVMFTQLSAGMRGLGHVYHAIGDVLPILGSDPKKPAPFPEGWDVDPEAFKCGLDLTTRTMTDADKKNLTGWYEQTMGMVPRNILFGLEHHPDYVKVHRAKWERAIKTLPKQLVPYILLRHNMVTGSVDGLREAALLGKAWGMTSHWLIQGITGTAYYFSGFDGLYTAFNAVEDLL
jgi:hypothetical protein